MSSKNPRRTTIFMLMTALLLVINGIGYLAYKTVKGSSDKSKVEATAVPTGAATSTAPGAATPTLEDKANAKLAAELRKAALKDILEDKYDDAAEKITKAMTLSSGPSDLPELLAMVKDRQAELKNSQPEEPEQEEVAAAPSKAAEAKDKPEPSHAAVAVKSKPRRRSERRVVRRRGGKRVAATEADKDDEEEAEPEEALPETGSIVVLSAPKLAFALDGKVMGVSPQEVETTPGAHTVSFRYGTKTLLRRTVVVSAGKKVSVDVDLADKIHELEVASLPKPDPKVETASVTPAKRVETAKPKPRLVEKRSGKVGKILVLSPVVSGVVYINGKRYGKAPVLAKNVSAGSAKVEIRSSSGRVVRHKRVNVKSGSSTTRVQFR